MRIPRVSGDPRLLEPARSAGGTRRYSDDDVQRLRRISQLLSGGLNLAGVAAVMELEAINQELRQQIADAALAQQHSHLRRRDDHGRRSNSAP